MTVKHWFVGRAGTSLVRSLWGKRFAKGAAASRRPLEMAIERLDTRVALAADSFAGVPREMVTLGDVCVFTAESKASGRELWVTDGTATGTRLLSDIAVGKASSDPSELTQVGSRIFFSADDGVNGRELWVTDGTPAGTRLVEDIRPGRETVWDWMTDTNVERNAWGDPQGLMEFGGKVFFAANDGVHGYELWSSDGTAQGTAMVKDIAPGQPTEGESFPSNMPAFVVGGRLMIRADDGMWATDGTADGTVLVAPVTLEQDWSLGGNTVGFARLGERVVFAGTDDAGAEPWITDGTPAGTSMLADIKSAAAGSFDYWNQPPAGFTTSGSQVFFFANDGEHGAELWRTDGTTAGTSLVKDIATGTHRDWEGQTRPDDSMPYPSSMLPFDGGILFAANDGVTGNELWKSDGTTAGTVLVKDLVPGSVKNPSASFDGKARIPLSGGPAALTRLGDAVYLLAKSGNQVWKTDGTAAGTVLVKDVDGPGNGSVGSGGYGAMAVLNGRLLFGGDSRTTGQGLWVSDGTTAGTVRMRDLAPRVVGVVPPAAKTYGVRETISFRVDFSEPVTVTGRPTLPITIGTRVVQAAYASGSGSPSLTFSYAVAPGLVDRDGIMVGALATPAGSTIRNAFRTGVKRDLPKPSLSGVLVDSVAPAVKALVAPANGTYGAGDVLAFAVTFSEAVEVTGTPSLRLTIGNVVREATFVTKTAADTLRFEYRILASDPPDANGIAVGKSIVLGGGSIKDPSGNAALLVMRVPSLAKVKVAQSLVS